MPEEGLCSKRYPLQYLKSEDFGSANDGLIFGKGAVNSIKERADELITLRQVKTSFFFQKGSSQDTHLVIVSCKAQRESPQQQESLDPQRLPFQKKPPPRTLSSKERLFVSSSS